MLLRFLRGIYEGYAFFCVVYVTFLSKAFFGHSMAHWIGKFLTSFCV